MKIFIWNRLPSVSDSYHKEGGLIVISHDLEKAKEFARKQNEDIFFTDIEWAPEEKAHVMVGATDVPPDYVFECDAKEEMVIAFPDTGCCY